MGIDFRVIYDSDLTAVRAIDLTPMPVQLFDISIQLLAGLNYYNALPLCFFGFFNNFSCMAIGRVIFFLSGPIPRKGQRASDDCQKGMGFFRPGIDPSNYIKSLWWFYLTSFPRPYWFFLFILSSEEVIRFAYQKKRGHPIFLFF